MQLKSLSILACIITLAFGSDVADILNDLNNVQSAFTALDNTVKGFSNSISQANDIAEGLVAAQSAIDQTNTDAQAVTPKPFSESDGLAVLETVNGLQGVLEDSLRQLAATEPALAAVSDDGTLSTIKQNLISLSDSTTALANELLSLTPADLLPPATDAADEIEATFQTAINAFN